MRNTTVLAGAASLPLIAAFFWWFGANWVLLGIYTVLAAVATLTVPLFYRLGGYTLADEIEWLEQREAAEHTELLQRLRELRGELDQLDIKDGVRQADVLVSILDDYHSVVETRFVGKKHSPMAYLSTARRVQKQAVLNLNDIVAVGHSLASISRHDGDHTDERRKRFESMNEDQRARLRALLDENNNLFSALTDTAVEVANISSYSEYERMDTLARLVSLAEIASRTGK